MERRKQGAIEEIARTALDLFARDRFDATSVEAIAAAAGCSPRTFYRYFGTKEDVMFHGLSDHLTELVQALDRHLADGLDPWAAVSESLVQFISGFDAADQQFPTMRMRLWLREPALGPRYMRYVHNGEHAIASCLHRHRGTTPERDDLPQLIAVAATGATRVILLTHTPANGRKLAEHLREALATLGHGLADKAFPRLRSTAARSA